MQYYDHRPLSHRIIKSKYPYSPAIYSGPRGCYHAWDEAGLSKAIEAKRSGVSYRRAAAMYGVPTTTLYDHMTGKVEIGAQPGPKPYLSADEEEELASFLIQIAKIGYPRTKSQVLALVQQVVDSKGISATVSNGWWERFLQRHPQLSLRAAVPLSLARAMATDSEVLAKYFDILEDCLVKNAILDKPGAIFNCDETGLPLNPACNKVVAKIGSKNPSFVTGGDKSKITVLACTSAVGYALLPFVIFDRQSLNHGMTKGEVPGTLYGLSRTGWINSDLFYDWFLRHFLQYAPPTRPLILLLDGHSAHYSPSTIRLAAENQVIVFVLPPHTTHIAQPLDRGCFSPLKTAWRKQCHEFRACNPGRVVTRYEFCQIFSKAWFKAMTGTNIISSFRATGVCPFNRHAFDDITLEGEGKCVSFKHHTLAEETGLAYIPLYSPSRRDDRCRPSMTSTPRTYLRSQHSFSDSEISFTAASPSNSSRPGQKSLDDSSCASAVPLRRETTLSKFLHLPPPSHQTLTKYGKSSGRVLTSQENLSLLAEKEKQKLDAAQKKEERRIKCEERKLQQQQKQENQIRNRQRGKRVTFSSKEDEDLTTLNQVETGRELSEEDCTLLSQVETQKVSQSAKVAVIRPPSTCNKEKRGIPGFRTRSVSSRDESSIYPSTQSSSTSSVDSSVMQRSSKSREAKTMATSRQALSSKTSRPAPSSTTSRVTRSSSRSREKTVDDQIDGELYEEDCTLKVAMETRKVSQSAKVAVVRPPSTCNKGERGIPGSRTRSVSSRDESSIHSSTQSSSTSSVDSSVMQRSSKSREAKTMATSRQAPSSKTSRPAPSSTTSRVTRSSSRSRVQSSINTRAQTPMGSRAPESLAKLQVTRSISRSRPVQSSSTASSQSYNFKPKIQGTVSISSGSDENGDMECVLVSDSDPDPNYWIQTLGLYDCDLQSLQPDKDVTENVVNAVHKILKLQFKVGGCQNTALGQSLKFRTVPDAVLCVQVINTGAHHWICSARVPGGHVCVFDSRALISNPITPDAELHLAKIYNPLPSQSSLRIEIASVQQQEGLHDCGLFAAAYAVEMCFGRRPESAHFHQHLMRKHLIKCLNEEHLEPFPTTKKTFETIPRPTHYFKSVKLYCVCNMPESFDKRMILCDDCNQWYHCSCVLSHTLIPDTWICSICRCK